MLYGYQQKAVDFTKSQKKVYLAMDMGMGKTITALASARDVGKKHILLVAEKNEIVNSRNFEREVFDHFEDLNYANLRDVSLDSVVGGNKRRFVCGINPDGLARLSRELIKENFDTMIVDESTMVKNTATARFKLIHKIAKEMEYVSLLSGTPMQNGAAELYAPLFLMDNPMVAGKGAEGKKAFEKVFAGGHFKKIRNTGKWFQDHIWHAKGANNVRVLRYLLRDHFFFMRKEETGVFKKKTRAIKNVQMTTAWLAEYTRAFEDYLEKAEKREVNMDNVMELRQLIEGGQVYMVNSRWKAKQIVEDIKNNKYSDQRIIVWTIYLETREQLEKDLTHAGIGWKTFEELKAWKAGTEQVLVGSMLANGKGSNVEEANVCIFADMSFVPAVNLQAECRIDRPSQTRDMLVVYYVTDGDNVIDTHVRNINQDKIRKIENFMKPLTEEEKNSMSKLLSELRRKYSEEMEILEI